MQDLEGKVRSKRHFENFSEQTLDLSGVFRNNPTNLACMKIQPVLVCHPAHKIYSTQTKHTHAD